MNQAGAAKSMEKLSSGFRINRAGDDAAGLAISEKMRGQIRGLKQAARNAQDGISLIQTAEGALNETHAILQRMRELAVQSSTDTNTDADRLEIQKEIDKLSEEITRISTDTQFNTMELLDGTFNGKVFHIGANDSQSVSLEILDMSAEALGVVGFSSDPEDLFDGVTVQNTSTEAFNITFTTATATTAETTAGASEGGTVTVTLAAQGTSGGSNYEIADGVTQADIVAALQNAGVNVVVDNADEDLDLEAAITSAPANVAVAAGEIDETKGIDVSSQVAADRAIKVIDDAIVSVSQERSMLGAMQNRLEHTIANLGTSAENLQAAEARIRDLDMAEEIMAFTKNNILQQAATAMLAQANMAPQSVLQLLG